MFDYEGVSCFGDELLVEIVKYIKKIEENWSLVVKG